jgi:heme exporter protein B
MGTKSSSWVSKATAVYHKDVVSEFRTRYSVNAVVLFAVTTLTAVSLSVGGFGVADRKLLAALLWIILFFSAMSGLSRAFVREEEGRTASALRLSAAPISIYLGKLVFNLTLLLGLEIVVVPLFVVLMHVEMGNWAALLLVLAFGSIGLSAAATIVAAIVSKANAKGALFAVLSFPIMAPLLVLAITGTAEALGGASVARSLPVLRSLVSYAGVMITASIMLFEFVWED